MTFAETIIEYAAVGVLDLMMVGYVVSMFTMTSDVIILRTDRRFMCWMMAVFLGITLLHLPSFSVDMVMIFVSAVGFVISAGCFIYHSVRLRAK